jgi:antagonist of KipI
MDPFAHRRANLLVGNAPGSATLEITLVGPTLVFERPARVALAGAPFSLAVDGAACGTDDPFEVAAGTTVAIGRPVRGARAYLGVAGGIDVPIVLGSRATHVPSGLGGVDGRAVQAGDVLPIGDPPSRPARRRWPPLEIPDGGALLRVLAGPEAPDFTTGEWDRLLSARFEIHRDSNRIGYRLTGCLLRAPLAEGFSTATPMGTIQVPEGGEPILLMADRQTSGGYPRIAHVISADLGLAGQLKPGDWVSFAACSHGEALNALRARWASCGPA